MTANCGVTLAGNGHVGTATIHNGATLSPSDGIGTFRVDTLTLAADSTVHFEISVLTHHDKVIVNSPLNLANVWLSVGSLGFEPVENDVITILTAGGVSGV